MIKFVEYGLIDSNLFLDEQKISKIKALLEKYDKIIVQ